MLSFFDRRPFGDASDRNGYSGNTIERWSEGRDEAGLAAALASENAGIYLFTEDRPLTHANGAAQSALFTLNQAQQLGLDPDSIILLGVTGEGPRFAGLVTTQAEQPTEVERADLRALAVEAKLPPGELGALAQARSYLYWHAGNRFCGRCGGTLASQRGGVSRLCRNCGTEHFPRVDPVVIMLAVDGNRCLLGRQPKFAPGMYSALAGFLEPGETIEEAVRRETKEEAGIHVGRVAYHSSQAWPFPSSLMIGCHAEAISPM
jgi:NAD+ diphosphatase